MQVREYLRAEGPLGFSPLVWLFAQARLTGEAKRRALAAEPILCGERCGVCG